MYNIEFYINFFGHKLDKESIKQDKDTQTNINNFKIFLVIAGLI